ncbi:MAG: MFS transporter [uncultured Thiotrichaceae bacterium]|uniref:MFS transporter n=1 Tax=uncultured Thiotrichaceae bacterium TaxID=298394 RepID=A0A6S6T8E8_9GAMM|nr:MAG: MFS transporter [uncultured Thiotrichaceae bacterium]
MTDYTMTTNAKPQKRSTPFADLVFSIIIPSIILLKLSSPDSLGATPALLLALAFPISWGLYSLLVNKSFNFIALLGLVSVGLTGGIGLLKLDPQWLAIKEATIPALIGIAVLILAQTKYSLLNWLVFNPTIMNVEKIKARLAETGQGKHFESRLLIATYYLAGTFMLSAVLNYVLAKWLVTSPAGSEAFNQELAKMTMMSYPVIAIPSTLAMIGIIYFLWKSIHTSTGLEFEEIMAGNHNEKRK